MKILKEILKLLIRNNELLKENNEMLKDIINYINIKESNHNNENDDDFMRNILANLISNVKR